ncbi:hypothetical protein FRN31_24055 [Vibrio alginolyticus]|nr:hypothetical protein [Vibrio alginolyticus]
MQSLRPNIYLKLCWRTSPNKRFKADSQRVAFAVCGKFSDLGGVRKHRYCVSHHLSGRYASLKFALFCTCNSATGLALRYNASNILS